MAIIISVHQTIVTGLCVKEDKQVKMSQQMEAVLIKITKIVVLSSTATKTNVLIENYMDGVGAMKNACRIIAPLQEDVKYNKIMLFTDAMLFN